MGRATLTAGSRRKSGRARVLVCVCARVHVCVCSQFYLLCPLIAVICAVLASLSTTEAGLLCNAASSARAVVFRRSFGGRYGPFGGRASPARQFTPIRGVGRSVARTKTGRGGVLFDVSRRVEHERALAAGVSRRT